MKTHDAIIVGGGIIGAALAFELATRKLRVLVLDRQEPGLEASWAAAGMLAPEPESADDAAVAPLGKFSFEQYPAFIERIESLSGMSVQLRRDGALRIFFGRDAEAESTRAAAAHRTIGLVAEIISPSEARAIEPALGPDAKAALLLRHECSVEPRSLTRAVLSACAKTGVEIRAGMAVEQILKRDGHCDGVAARGEKFHADIVVIAAGSFSALVEGAAPFAPTIPVRGQIVALQPHEGGPKRVLRSDRGYVVPRNDGRIIAGSTHEDAGFEKCVTAEGMQQILNAATELAPRLASAAIVDSWSGLRPGTPDHLPILGPSELEGLWIATGHYRNGILLAPGTAQLMAEWIVDGKPSLALEQFSPLRFAAAQRTAAR